MNELDKAYKAYEAKFDEEPPLMFLEACHSMSKLQQSMNE